MGTREEKRSRIVKGALELVLKYGLRKTTIEDIATQARLKPASVYYYFESKEEIFAAVVHEAAEQVISKVRIAVDAADTAEGKLVAFFEARYSYLALIEGLTKAVAIELYPTVEEAISDFEDHGRSVLEAVLVSGTEQGEFDVDNPEALALGLMTGMRGMDSMFIMYSLDSSTIDGLQALLKVFLNGLRAR